MAPKLRRRAFTFTNAILPQTTGAVSFRRLLGGGENAPAEKACAPLGPRRHFSAAAFAATTWRSKAPTLSTKITQSEALSQLVVCR